MATILLSAVGAAIGSGFGGTVLGLSGAVIGRAVGATLGRVIDQRLLGAGSDPVETGRIERFRLTGASEGAAIPRPFGRVRMAGQIIWATRFLENRSTSGGGKGAPSPRVTSYSYSVSFAVALCEGEISAIGRVWADGAEIDASTLNMRVYTGSETQLPDPKIEAVEGAGNAPAYRGTAYLVIEDLELSAFGNRVPQLSFEVIRPAQGTLASASGDMRNALRGVALMPGTGEYALATTPLHFEDGPGLSRAINVNSPSGKSDMETSLTQLEQELPNVGAVSLIVSWFGSDLRCGSCEVQPKVEQTNQNAKGMAWRAGGITRSQATPVARIDDRPIYGGTPADASVLEAIARMQQSGQEVMFYPFILMEQLAGNALPDPWSDAGSQPALPWRGRITLSEAPGRPGTPDRTAAAEAEVAAFFGTAQPSDFAVSGGQITYSGPAEWRYRRFILHYAHLCALAGGVEAFCIGSEMRSLTQIRGGGDSFPAVTALRALAADVRAILGPDTKISYAADWSEYFGYQTDGNVYFHLDPLWADPNIDFIGIDNYMPASDWREGDDHADAGFGSVQDLGYLKSNILGGEGFDWYYDSPEGEAAQRRLPIEDGAFGEDWIFRYKDLPGWWSNPHHDRIDGIRAATPTAWQPASKPIRFTEFGCAAIDKGTNQPNRFLDPKSSESGLPKYSNGRRDDFLQMQYLRAMAEVWTSAQNPVSPVYEAPMVDWAHSYAWAWDARPFPAFPNTLDLWTDGVNYARGHWLTGRATNQPLASVVADLCERAGLSAFDSASLRGVVRGYIPEGVGTARAALQPLMLAYGFEAVDRDGLLRFQMRAGVKPTPLPRDHLAVVSALDGALETARAPAAEMAGRVRLGFVEAEADYAIRQVEAIFPDDQSRAVSQSELPLTLTEAEGLGIVERWLSEARVARDTARFALPPSLRRYGAGDLVSLDGITYRIDRIEQSEAGLVEALRSDPSLYDPSDAVETRVAVPRFVASGPVFPLFMDLPLLTGEETPQAPHIAVTATPWPGPVAVWSAVSDAGYALNRLVEAPATLGVTLSPLFAARPGLWDRSEPLQIRLSRGTLSAASREAVLAGANLMAIGDGSPENWELFQFADVLMTGPDSYEVSTRLRGQLGSDGILPPVWPAGSYVVLMDRAPVQIDLALTARGLIRNYRIGAATKGLDDPMVQHRVTAFSGIGLRPYAPAHLRARLLGPDLALSWVRRTRIDGDRWDSAEVPLAEEAEAYRIRILQGGTLLREVQTTAPEWLYSAAMQAQDGASGPLEVEVAQLSAAFGPGPAKRLSVGL
jgi:hypothetical protein